MSHTLRLGTWNIQLGYQLETILQVIKENRDFADLDLLALQEASVHDDVEDAQVIAHALGPTFQSNQVTAHFVGKSPQANAILWNSSRVDITRIDTVNLPRREEVVLSQFERTLLGALPQQQRISIVADGTVEGQLLRFYAAHLDVLGVGYKREQFQRILLDAHRRLPPTAATILAGDLNTFRLRSRPSWAGLTAAAEAEGFQDLTSEILWTHRPWRRVMFRQKLDAIFVRCDRQCQNRSWSLDVRGSDHIPVFAEITWSSDSGAG
jgi:endonuclease/exonuclease/phosphatase family metal-dependent hydrolase